MNTQQKIAVMQAFVDGKAIESRDKRLSGTAMWALWVPGDEPNWNWEQLEYRVAVVVKAVRYMRYVRETQNYAGAPWVRTCSVLYETGEAPHSIESRPGFVRWVDTEWQTP